MVGSPDFNEEYASAAGWARQYRALGLQVVPAYLPSEVRQGTAWKRPRFAEWREFQDVLVPDAIFDRWYGQGGEYVGRLNMGTICGRASGNLFIIDLDVHKKPEAALWWGGLLAVHNNNMPPETAEQRTGGGGRQILFYAPPGWHCPTCKTPIGVDIRGQGGFAVLAPSIHDTGASYTWLEGFAPWDDAGIMMAPDWLLEAVAGLVKTHGGGTGGSPGARADGPQPAFDGFGHQTDGREQKMTELVWGAVVDWYRECPIKPSDTEQQAKEREKYLIYEAQVSPRVYEPSLTKGQMLDREGRGAALFHVKWSYAMRLWDTKVAEEAKKPGKDKTGTGFGGSKSNPWDDEFAKANNNTSQPGAGPLVLTDLEFTKDFKPPKYLVNGIIQKGYLYSLTGPTGHGKTPISMYMGSRIARGLAFHSKPVAQGGVLFLAGENADDIRARYIAMADHEKFDIGSIPFYFIDGVINIHAEMDRIQAAAALIPNLSLVIIDTDQAYFLGDEGNSNEQRKWFAQLLRRLLKLPGNPAALVNCHPTKNATQDNLVPIGGSSFLNEVDGNITCWTEDRTCVIKPHSSKWRGVEFESLAFELRTITCDRLKDEDGQSMPSVMAVPITEEGAQRRAAVAEEDDKVVLRLLHAARDASLAAVARNAGWFWPDGSPSKTKVQRIVDRLVKGKLLRKIHGGKYRLTKAGCGIVGLKFERYDDDDE